MSKYRYRLWCGDCYGDDQGCFDGSSSLSQTYDTFELANEAGQDASYDCAPWEYCVTDEAGNEIKKEEP